MVRRCAVNGCRESDVTLLCHRFPKLPEIVKTWQNALDLKHILIDDLQRKFVVCTKHFPPLAYRNEISNSLNSTAVPNLQENSSNERIKNTVQTLKRELSAPIRCHKLPPVERRVTFKNPLKKFKPTLFEDYEQPETFEVYECSLDEFVDQTPKDQEQIEISDPVASSSHIPHLMLETKEASTMTTELVHMTNQASQTQPEIPNVPAQESKDDKLLNILYPELKDKSKAELAEIINEKNQKIESLEDKVKKLELAMRSLL